MCLIWRKSNGTALLSLSMYHIDESITDLNIVLEESGGNKFMVKQYFWRHSILNGLMWEWVGGSPHQVNLLNSKINTLCFWRDLTKEMDGELHADGFN